ncbi:MAG: sensor histidine kinase [Sphingobacteriaceae bacterium]|nr:sensor histidine kinase [Sphingobacteriaceae bacterium]
MKLKAIFYLTIFSIGFSKAQSDKKEFCDKFYAADFKNRITLTSKLSPSKLYEVYPLIKDTLELAKKLIREKSESKEAKLLVELIEAKLELSRKNYTKAVFALEQGLNSYALNVNDSLLCYSLLKTCFVGIRNYIKAYEVNSRMELMRLRKSDSVIIDYGIPKSKLYASLNFFDKAIAERRNEFNKSFTVNDTDALASLYNDVGVYFNRQKNSDSAEASFLKAKQVLESMNIPEEKAIHYSFFKALIGGNLGFSYFNKGKIKEAIPLLKEDIYYSLKDNDFGSAFNSYNLMVECYLQLNNKELAKKYLDSSEHLLSKGFSDISQSLKYLYLKATFFQAQKQYDNAILYFNRYFNIKDSLNTAEKMQNLNNAEIAFQIEQKEFELQEKNKMLIQQKLEDEQIKSQRAYQFIGILVLTALIIVLLWRNRYVKKRQIELQEKTSKIIVQNQQIEQSLKEKDILLREVHHRVKNNLQIINSLLGLHISKLEGTGNEVALEEVKQRIASIALTHQLLYQNTNLSNISLNDFVHNIVWQIERSFSDSQINLDTQLEANGLKLNIDYAVPLGLLINELLSNAYNHAFPKNKKGSIVVSVKIENDKCVIAVLDNGVGMSETMNVSDKTTMGMDLINILAEQIDSEIKIKTDANGTAFYFEMDSSKFPS